jgi:hypothetical protein
VTRALDEVADALQRIRSSFPTGLLVRSVRLAHQFGLPVTPGRWHDLAERLRCELPPLEGAPAWGWGFPHGWRTVRDLAEHVACQRPGCEPPGACSEAEWVEAQIFVRVREVLVDALNVDPGDVTREARLLADLGAY